MKVFLQCDHPSRFNPHSDSTIPLALEAQARGYEVYYYTPSQLSAVNGCVMAQARPITFYPRLTDWYEEGAAQFVSLEEAADVILVRQDPPFDMAYLTTTWLLGMLKKPRVFNSPRALRERPEKLFPLHFPAFCPPTLISANVEELLAYQQEIGEAVLKPLYGHGGHGIFRIPADRSNLAALLEMLFQHSGEPVILQQFLPAVATEEKRILLVNGEIMGAFGRIPAKGEIRSNMRVGGEVIATTLTPYQQEICEAIRPFCQQEGLMLVGLDVIGDTLTEINITSPTGLRALEMLYQTNTASHFWEAVNRSH
jgi:glutathione synthase